MRMGVWRGGMGTIVPSLHPSPVCRIAATLALPLASMSHASVSVSQACRMRPGVCLFEVEPCLLAILALFVCTRS